MRLRLSRRSGALLLLLALATGVGGWYAYRSFTFRLLEVIPGRIYRSRQPSPEDLRRAVKNTGLASVVNLRGANLDRSWYLDERRASRALGLRHFDLRVKSSDWPALVQVRRLIDFLDEAPEPLLLHCDGGFHRSGWASAFVRVLEGESVSEARSEISGVRTSIRQANNDSAGKFFDLYEDWLRQQGETHSGDLFRRWATEIYCPPDYCAALRLDSPPAAGWPAAFAPGEKVTLGLSVSNIGSASWSGVRAGALLRGPFEHPPGAPIGHPGCSRCGRLLALGPAEVPLASLPPGETTGTRIELTLPTAPGHYLLEVNLVDDESDWFHELGTAGLALALEVSGEPGFR